jgi:hypothetical protein
MIRRNLPAVLAGVVTGVLVVAGLSAVTASSAAAGTGAGTKTQS